jgi:hypothetical protein
VNPSVKNDERDVEGVGVGVGVFVAMEKDTVVAMEKDAVVAMEKDAVVVVVVVDAGTEDVDEEEVVAGDEETMVAIILLSTPWIRKPFRHSNSSFRGAMCGCLQQMDANST